MNIWYQLVVFTPLESPAIYVGDEIDKILIPHRKGGVNAPSFLTGFTFSAVYEVHYVKYS